MINTLGQCSWTDCGGSCPAGTTQLTQTLTGDGGDSPCSSGRRSLCCSTSGGNGFIPSTCGWYRNAYHNTCTPGCPQGKVQLAVDSAGANCVRGFGSFCCDPPVNFLAGRSDPQVQSFKSLVHAYVTNGRCSAFPGLGRKRQISLLSPTSHDMAIRLAPMLYDWEWLESERKYITPFQQTWDDEVRGTGNLFPSFDSLADSLAGIDTSTNNAVDYLDRKLCNLKVRGTFDPIMCSSKKCSGGSACPRKRMMGAVPDDITNQFFDTTAVTNGLDFTDPSTTPVGATHWWQQAKNLDWWRGSNHGIDSITGAEIASSAFVNFAQDPGHNIVTGAGPVWGCTTVAVVSNFGAWTAHFWQGFFEEDDAAFQQKVLDFLEWGNWLEAYPGLAAYTGAGGAFDLARTSFLSVVIMTPKVYQMSLPDPILPPVVVPGFGPLYPTRVAAIQRRLDQIFGVADGTLNTIVHTYASDQLIWDSHPSDIGLDASGQLYIHWSWSLDRSPRMVTNPYTGMMTIQRRATNVPGLRPAVRVFCGNTLEFTQTW